jgi:hypothetical protein
LFKIDGKKGFGCKWNDYDSECVDIILGENNLPENCGGYGTSETCNYHMIKNGSTCFWNPDKNGDLCMGVDDVEACGQICTNNMSGINTHFCDGNSVITDSTSEMCKWGVVSEETFTHGCNCEGVDIPENCTLLNVSYPSECKKFISGRGGCFFNGNIQDKISGIGVCSDIGDVMECEYFLDQSLCTYAKKHIYYNLENYSSASSTTFLCIWNAEKEGGTCQSKQLGRSMNDNNSKFSTILLLIIIVGVVFLIIIVLVLIIIIKRVKSRGSRIKEYEMYSSNNLNNSINNNIGYLCYLCIFFCNIFKLYIFYYMDLLFFNVVKYGTSHEYTIGEIIGNYEIEKIIGRGFFFFFFFLYIYFNMIFLWFIFIKF